MTIKKKHKPKFKGFTLVELVIVISVIAILAAVLIPTFADLIKNAKRNSRLQATSVRDEYLTLAQDPNEIIGSLIKVKDDFYIIGNNLELIEINIEDFDIEDYDQIYDITGVKIYRKRNKDIYNIIFKTDEGTINSDYTKLYIKYKTAEFFKDYNLIEICDDMPTVIYDIEGYVTTFEGWRDGNTQNSNLVVDKNGKLIKDTKYIDEDGKFIYDDNLVLYAFYQKQAINYPINYVYLDSLSKELSSEDISNPNQTEYNIETNFILKDIVKPNYIFKGWYKDILFKEPVSELTNGNIGEKTFYAKFEEGQENEYKIEYYCENLYGDYDLVETKTLKDRVGNEVQADTTITFQGFKYDNENLSGENVLSNVVSKDIIITLKVYYLRNSYEVIWKLDDSTELKRDSRKFGESPNYNGEIPQKPDDNGYRYTFEGWLPNITEIKESTTLLAVFNKTAINYTIEYDSKGGIIEEKRPTSYTVESETIILPEPTKKGYTFVGWTEYNYLTNKEIEKGVVTQILKGTIGNLKYTARYILTKYTIVYNAIINIDGDIFTIESSDFENNNLIEYTIETETFNLEEPVKEGYIFEGWTFGDETIPNKNIVVNKGSTGNLEYTANFVAKTNTKYVVKYYKQNTDLVNYDIVEDDIENLTGTTDTTVTAFEKEYEGFTIDKTKSIEGVIKGDGSLVIKVYYNRNKYRVHYEVDGGEVLEDEYYIYGIEKNLSETSKKGYNFNGWKLSESEVVENGLTKITSRDIGNKVFYANFKIIDYNIEYELDNGELEEGKTNLTTYTIDTDTFTLNNPYKRGYTFTGWTGTNISTPKSVVTINKGTIGDLSYIANYEIIIYKIEYNLNNGELEEGEINKIEYTVDTDTFTLNNPYKEGYTFTGWTGTDINTPKNVVTISKGTIGDLSYTANYNILTYLISYDLSGGQLKEGEFNLIEYTVETETFVLSTPYKDGFTFLGWTGSNGEEPQTDVRIEKGKNKGNLTFVANFECDFDTANDENGNLIVTGYKGKSTEVKIPSTIEGKTVIAIGDGAFKSKNITSVKMSDTITSIGSYAFHGCENLKEVEIPDGVTKIEKYVFALCAKLENVKIPNSVVSIDENVFSGCSSLSSIEIPDSVENIGVKAFINSGLTSITIPNSITKINDNVFENCKKLEELVLSSNLTSIGNKSFYGCTSLNNVLIPSSVTIIQERAFHRCTKLSNATFEKTEGWVRDISNSNGESETTISSGDVLKYADEIITNENEIEKLIRCDYYVTMSYNSSATNKRQIILNKYIGNETNIIVPLDYLNCRVVGIGDSAYRGSKIKEITLSGDIASISNYAFADCSKLQYISMNDFVTSIGSSAFYNCEKLNNVTLPSSLTIIESYAFQKCVSLTKITIPYNVKKIGSYAFSLCTSLTSVTFLNTTGWKAGDSAITISNSSKENADNLTNQYASVIWKRS